MSSKGFFVLFSVKDFLEELFVWISNDVFFLFLGEGFLRVGLLGELIMYFIDVFSSILEYGIFVWLFKTDNELHFVDFLSFLEFKLELMRYFLGWDFSLGPDIKD